jgi:hypothetical protein
MIVCAARLAVRNQQPIEPVRVRNGSPAPVSEMYSACATAALKTAAVPAAPPTPAPNVTAPLLVRVRPLPLTSLRSLRFHRPCGAFRPSAVKSTSVRSRPARI